MLPVHRSRSLTRLQPSYTPATVLADCTTVIYIGKSTSLLDPAIDEVTLIARCKDTWNKPAAFTWNPSTGLEMHYRIQPPADWIVSSAEDESMSTIDLDLSELDGSQESVKVNAEMKHCTSCHMVSDVFDQSRTCEECDLVGAEETLDGNGWTGEPPLPVSLSFGMELFDPWDSSAPFDFTTPNDFGPLVALPSSLNCLDFSIPELAPDSKLYESLQNEPLKSTAAFSWPAAQTAMPPNPTSPHYTSEVEGPHTYQYSFGELDLSGTSTYPFGDMFDETLQCDPFQFPEHSNFSQ